MSTQREFWSDIGRGSGDGETCGRFLPTPRKMEIVTGKNAQGGLGLTSWVSLYPDGTLTSSAVASPARISAMLARVRDWTENGLAYSTKQPASFAHWDQDTCSWKTSQRCLAGGLETFSGRWCRSGLIVNGIASALEVLVPRISGTGCSSSAPWPTPYASDTGDRGVIGGRGNWGLSMAAQAYPIGQPDVDYIQASKPKNARRMITEGGQLSPGFVEWLMGFPKDWTKLEE